MSSHLVFCFFVGFILGVSIFLVVLQFVTWRMSIDKRWVSVPGVVEYCHYSRGSPFSGVKRKAILVYSFTSGGAKRFGSMVDFRDFFYAYFGRAYKSPYFYLRVGNEVSVYIRGNGKGVSILDLKTYGKGLFFISIVLGMASVFMLSSIFGSGGYGALVALFALFLALLLSVLATWFFISEMSAKDYKVSGLFHEFSLDKTLNSFFSKKTK